MSGSRTMQHHGGTRLVAVAAACLALGFMVSPAMGADDAEFVSWTGLPSASEFMSPGETRTVTVRMKNTGTQSWSTRFLPNTVTFFTLFWVGDTWGLDSGSTVAGVPVFGTVAPDAVHDFTFTITAPSTAGSYSFQFRMRRITETNPGPNPGPVVASSPAVSGFVGSTPFGDSTSARTIWVGTDTVPTFGSIADQDWTTGVAVDLDLGVTGGNGDVTCSNAPALPAGVSLDASSCTVSGTPSADEDTAAYTFTATDADGNTAPTDAGVVTFDITVGPPCSLVVSPNPLVLVEGGEADLTVSLSRTPTGRVNVPVVINDLGAVKLKNASDSPLQFTSAAAQQITLEGVWDDDRNDEQTSVTLTSIGGGCDSTVTVDVTVVDQPRPYIDLGTIRLDDLGPPEPLYLTVIEGESVTFGASLSEPPSTGGATVTVTEEDISKVSASPSSLDFDASNYSSPQQVSVSGHEAGIWPRGRHMVDHAGRPRGLPIRDGDRDGLGRQDAGPGVVPLADVDRRLSGLDDAAGGDGREPAVDVQSLRRSAGWDVPVGPGDFGCSDGAAGAEDVHVDGNGRRR